MKFAKQYGPVFKLYFMNRLMVVLNGYDVIKGKIYIFSRLNIMLAKGVLSLIVFVSPASMIMSG